MKSMVCGFVLTVMPSSAAVLISEVVDATQSGGLPKYVELTNTGTTAISLNAYSIANFNNGNTTMYGGSSTMLSGVLVAGGSYVISYENGDSAGSSTFNAVYGFDADNMNLGTYTNGDDAYVLYLGSATGDGSNGTVVDAYGVVGVDGTGESWEYMDSYARRNFNVNSPNTTFTLGEWTFAGVNALDGASPATIASLTNPSVHNFTPTPEPSTMIFSGLAVTALMLRRQKRSLFEYV